MSGSLGALFAQNKFLHLKKWTIFQLIQDTKSINQMAQYSFLVYIANHWRYETRNMRFISTQQWFSGSKRTVL